MSTSYALESNERRKIHYSNRFHSSNKLLSQKIFPVSNLRRNSLSDNSVKLLLPFWGLAVRYSERNWKKKVSYWGSAWAKRCPIQEYPGWRPPSWHANGKTCDHKRRLLCFKHLASVCRNGQLPTDRRTDWRTHLYYSWLSTKEFKKWKISVFLIFNYANRNFLYFWLMRHLKL